MSVKSAILERVDVRVDCDGWSALGDPETLARRCCAAVADEYPDAAAPVAILFTDDASAQSLNRRYRGMNLPTNVLSFPAGDGLSSDYLGDIALAFETCALEAEEKSIELADHVAHLLAHGVLHLIGYDHETDAAAEEMEAAESRILARLGVRDPYREETG